MTLYYLPDVIFSHDFSITVFTYYTKWHHARKYRKGDIIEINSLKYEALKDNKNIKLTNAAIWKLKKD